MEYTSGVKSVGSGAACQGTACKVLRHQHQQERIRWIESSAGQRAVATAGCRRVWSRHRRHRVRSRRSIGCQLTTRIHVRSRHRVQSRRSIGRQLTTRVQVRSRHSSSGVRSRRSIGSQLTTRIHVAVRRRHPLAPRLAQCTRAPHPQRHQDQQPHQPQSRLIKMHRSSPCSTPRCRSTMTSMQS